MSQDSKGKNINLILDDINKKKDEFITIDKGSHNDLYDFPLFHEKLDSILSL